MTTLQLTPQADFTENTNQARANNQAPAHKKAVAKVVTANAKTRPASPPLAPSPAKSSAAKKEKTHNPVPAYILSVVVAAALYLGWTIRDEYYLSAEYGLGYALGIIGGSSMLILILYPLKKHFNNLNLVLSTKNWFDLHMILGVIGPVLIMYHCNFNTGSFNSNVALFCTILMVTSGVIGRYIYGKIYYGLYDKQDFLKQLQQHKVFSIRRSPDGNQGSFRFVSQDAYKKLRRYEERALQNRGVFGSLLRYFTLGLVTRLSYYRLCRTVGRYHDSNPAFGQLTPQQKRKMTRTVHHHINLYLRTIRKISAISLYERMFSLWHVLHLPIFFMLIITGFIHVYAVHMY